jgi:hypothetical protein
MDNTIAEQVVPVVDDCPDLREAPDAGIGYNGRKQFKQTRSKKNFKFTNNEGHSNGRQPQQLLNDTSVDFIETSKLVYTSGQMIDDAIEAQANYPTVDHTGAAVAKPLKKGNYKLNSFNFTVSNGHITAVSFGEDKYEVHAGPIVRDQANFNAQVDANNITKTMIKIQNELGRETTDKWTPLAYVIGEPYQVNMFYHDIEATLGAVAAIAYRSAVSSMAFQKNILSKDGINPQRNAIKMMMEGYAGRFSKNDTAAMTDLNFANTIFNKKEYRKGSAAAIIEMFDSTSKYRTKADILGLQRSLGMHLSQADNNLNPLHCKKEFIKALDKAHMFSTVDGNYNPMLPIFTTKKISIVNPLSLNFFLAGWKNPALLSDAEKADIHRDNTTGTYSQYTYQYADIRNRYTTRIQHPLVEGILRWLLKHEGAVVRTFGEGSTTMPASFDFENPSLFQFIVCSALQDIVYERNIIFRDILFAGEQFTYIWDDLQGLDSLNPLYSSQLTIGKYDEPLKLGKLAADTAVRELWGGHMQLTDFQQGVTGVKSAKAQYTLPWYFNEHAFGSQSGSYTSNEGFYNEPSAFNMTYPSIRDGVRHEYVDIIKSMDPNDVRLSLDRLLDIPCFDEETQEKITISGVCTNYPLWYAHTNNNTSAELNSKIKLGALRYEANSDGRVVVTYDLTEDANKNITKHALYLVPKEIGFIDDDYSTQFVFDGYTTAADGNNPVTITYTNKFALGEDFEVDVDPIGEQFVYSGYSPVTLISYRVDGDSDTAKAIDRSAALTQVFYRCFADQTAVTVNNRYVAKTGIIPTLGYNDGKVDELYAVYNLDSDHESTTAIDVVVHSMAGRIWTQLQRFFMPVDRFANCYTIDEKAHAYDSLEPAFYFGVCGTLAADYTQCVLERLDVYDQLGIDYTEDINVKDSLIFR